MCFYKQLGCAYLQGQGIPLDFLLDALKHGLGLPQPRRELKAHTRTFSPIIMAINTQRVGVQEVRHCSGCIITWSMVLSNDCRLCTAACSILPRFTTPLFRLLYLCVAWARKESGSIVTTTGDLLSTRHSPVIDRLGHPLNPTGVVGRVHGNQFLGQTVEQLDLVLELVQFRVE